MLNEIIKIRAGAAALLFLAAFFRAGLVSADFQTDCADFDTAPLRRTEVVLTSSKNRAEVSAEAAVSATEKMRGLMCRKSLADGSAMLFPYPRPVSGGFWMFNTHIGLDILYIAENGKVIKRLTMSPCPREGAENKAQWRARCLAEAQEYRPPAPYIAALEVPAGYLERAGFQPEKPVSALWDREILKSQPIKSKP